MLLPFVDSVRKVIRPGPFTIPILLAGLLLVSCRVEEEDVTAEKRTAHSQANLLANSSFEALDEKGLPSSWWIYAPDGAHVLKGTCPDGEHAVSTSQETSLSQALPVIPGEQYVVGHYTRGEQGKSARLQVNFLDHRGEIVYVKIAPIQVGPEWRWQELSMTAPATASTAIVYVTAHENGSADFDSVWFGQGSSVK